jgi:hypothetical protein
MKKYRDTDPNQYKRSNNQLLLEMCQSVWCPECLREKGTALYLDGPQMISSSIFADHFRDLFIAQCNEEDYEEMKRKSRYAHVHIENTTVREYIETDNLKYCQLFYLDYMNCVYGSITKKEYPLHDLDQILKRSMNEQIVLGLTFVSRMILLEKPFCKRKDEKRTLKRESTKIMWYDFLQPTIRSRGYDIEKWECVEYCKESHTSAPMVFFAMILKKKKNLPKQVFHMHPSNIFRVGFDQNDPDECYRVKKSSKQYKEAYKEYYDEKKMEWRMPWKIVDS